MVKSLAVQTIFVSSFSETVGNWVHSVCSITHRSHRLQKKMRRKIIQQNNGTNESIAKQSKAKKWTTNNWPSISCRVVWHLVIYMEWHEQCTISNRSGCKKNNEQYLRMSIFLLLPYTDSMSKGDISRNDILATTVHPTYHQWQRATIYSAIENDAKKKENVVANASFIAS